MSQPEHFPYLGFFQKIAQADCFVLLDSVKFQGKGSFQVRNWFVNTQGRREWFTAHVPKGSHHLRIDEVPLCEGQAWRRAYREKLLQNLGFDAQKWLDTSHLVELNLRAIEYGCIRFGIDTPLVRSSTLEAKGEKSMLVANLCRAIGATTYLSGPGAMGYLDLSCFEGMSVEVFEPTVPDHQSFLAHRYHGLWS